MEHTFLVCPLENFLKEWNLWKGSPVFLLKTYTKEVHLPFTNFAQPFQFLARERSLGTNGLFGEINTFFTRWKFPLKLTWLFAKLKPPKGFVCLSPNETCKIFKKSLKIRTLLLFFFSLIKFLFQNPKAIKYLGRKEKRFKESHRTALLSRRTRETFLTFWAQLFKSRLAQSQG